MMGREAGERLRVALPFCAFMAHFRRILIANRGEIALRVIRTAQEMGIETVAVYSEADRGSAYLDLADETYCIGTAKAADSYLRIDRIISAAEVGNVQAIHPGYGLLAENAHFADVCRSCEIEFIARRERVVHLDDLILRRTLIGLLGQTNRGLLKELAAIMTTSLEWTEARAADSEKSRTRTLNGR